MVPRAPSVRPNNPKQSKVLNGNANKAKYIGLLNY
jgi:hypothetical protein